MILKSIKDGLEQALGDLDDRPLGVAVSGGGDSMALLHLLAGRKGGLFAVSVDHGLRVESADEAQMVARVCAELGVSHDIVKWQGWDGKGNLQEQARLARQRLISGWAKEKHLEFIALGHTFDDQAETVLLRLARGSGVDGLSGMAARRSDGKVTWVRPLLHAHREELRNYLRSLAAEWMEDPSNDDPKYDRVKARLALKQLEGLGLDADGLVATAGRMREARGALELATLELAKSCVEVSDIGEVKIARQTFTQAPGELRHRLFAAALGWVSREGFRPRLKSLKAVLADVDKGHSLHGCIVRANDEQISIRREPSRVQEACDIANMQWDKRWHIEKTPDANPANSIATLGEAGLQQVENWRESGHARESLLTTPALWLGDELIAAPMAGMANGWSCRLIADKKGFLNSLITH